MSSNLEGKKLGIIHAATLTVPTLAAFAREMIPQVEVMNAADDTVQRDNLSAPVGTIPKRNYYKFATLARFLEEGEVDMIMLACSTFNSAVDVARPMINIPMLQIDRPMMEKAVATGRKIGLLGTLPSTMPASERLLRECARDADKEIEVVDVLNDKAFQVLQAGDKRGHNEMLLKDIARLEKEVDCIVLAQASMSALEPELKNCGVPVYTSPRLAFERVRTMLADLN